MLSEVICSCRLAIGPVTGHCDSPMRRVLHAVAVDLPLLFVSDIFEPLLPQLPPVLLLVARHLGRVLYSVICLFVSILSLLPALPGLYPTTYVAGNLLELVFDRCLGQFLR